MSIFFGGCKTIILEVFEENYEVYFKGGKLYEVLNKVVNKSDDVEVDQSVVL